MKGIDLIWLNIQNRYLQKNINKMFANWEPSVVAALHKYFEAFSALYGCIQIKDAWKVFKNYEPKIHKKQFIEFSEIVRRENVRTIFSR